MQASGAAYPGDQSNHCYHAGRVGVARMTDFFDVVLGQRACRRFSDRPVDDALVERCIEAATHAPSAENTQPWEFVVVRHADRRAAIGALNRAVWRSAGRAHSVGRLAPALLAEVDRGAEGGLAAAPVMVVVCGNAELGLPSTLPASVFPAVQNLLVAASALGLGSAMTTLALQRADELRALLALPPHVVPMAVVPLGWPERPLGPPRRLPVAERTHRETYGVHW
jgi:nitroreductase